MNAEPRPKILFAFPHPDDESFLTGGTIATLSHSGMADTFVYTLTRGEASRNAAFHGITPEEIAALRVEEVRLASEILGADHVQGAFPDGGLRDMDPRILERDLSDLIHRIDPDVLVTYDVQGASVHPDHIVLHHVAKRVFLEERERGARLRRLAFCGQPADRIAHFPRRLFGLPEPRIHVRVDVSAYLPFKQRAIDAHVSVRQDVIENNHDNWMMWNVECFSLFQERINPAVPDLLTALPSV